MYTYHYSTIDSTYLIINPNQLAIASTRIETEAQTIINGLNLAEQITHIINNVSMGPDEFRNYVTKLIQAADSSQTEEIEEAGPPQPNRICHDCWMDLSGRSYVFTRGNYYCTTCDRINSK